MKDNLENFNHTSDFSPKGKNQPRSKNADAITDELLKDGLLKARSNDGEIQPPSITKDLELIPHQQRDSSKDDMLTD